MIRVQTENLRSEKEEGSPPVPLNEEHMKYIFKIKQDVGIIKPAQATFLALLVQCPVKVTLKSFKLDQSQELEYLLKHDWQEWHRQLYLWISDIGVFPYYFEKVRGTIHYRPKVPPFGSGYVSVYQDENHEQQYKWTWHQGKQNKKFYFVTWLNPPLPNGMITTSIMSLIKAYKLLEKAETAQEIVWYGQSHPQHILEYKPSNASIREINTYQTFHTGEQMMGIRPEKVHELRTTKIRDATKSIRETNRRNAQYNFRSRTGRPLSLDEKEQEEKWERNNAALLEHLIPLDPDFVYKAVPPPKLEANISQLREELEHRAAQLMDFPSESMRMGGRKITAQAQNDLRFLNERVKTWINFLESQTRIALLKIYGKLIQDTLNKAVRVTKTEFTFLAYAELQVEMQCTPLTTWDELEKYVDRGLMSEEDFGVHAFRLKALPLTQLQVPHKEEECDSC